MPSSSPRDASPRRRSALRLGLAFTAILALFAVALVVELSSLRRLAASEDVVARLDHAKHAGHMVAALVREQYIHQAHSLIELDDSHLGHYRDAVHATVQAVDHLATQAASPEERQLVAQIAEAARASDDVFSRLVVPALSQADPTVAKPLGERLETMADQAVALSEQLNASFERRSAAGRAQAVELRTQARQVTVLCFALAILLATGVGVWLTNSIVRPMRALQAGARRVGAGDLTSRIGLTGKDEFAELAEAFDHMTASLARKQEDLLRAQRLASIGQVAAGVAHEINNPLSVILGYTKLLRRQAELEELAIVEAEAVQCQRIVQDLLDLARPQHLEVQRVDLVQLAREAVDRLDEAGALTGRTVEIQAAEVPVRGDAGRLRQVLANVVLNAAQASPAGGVVLIEAARAAGEACLTVSDTGAGMPPEVLAHVFEPFFTTRQGGTGLGLAIAQTIVDAHGGRLAIESEVGRGTKVSLHLPLADEDLA